jgi:DNA-binding NarL/FixJ family response regulator
MSEKVRAMPGGTHGSSHRTDGAAERKARIRVILADDHPIVRLGIRAELEKIPGLEVIKEASDGRQALELVEELRPDVVVMDISMPGLNGLEATERITKTYPDVRVIILSRHQDEGYYWRAVRNGASGYVLKKAAIVELAEAVRRAVGGEIYLSKEISAKMIRKFPAQHVVHARGPLEQLSERQREVLQLIAEGQTTKAIALILKVSAKTVEYHRAKLMERLNIHDIPNLVRFALRSHLISEET